MKKDSSFKLSIYKDGLKMLKSDTKRLTFWYTLRFSISPKISLYVFSYGQRLSLFWQEKTDYNNQEIDNSISAF